MGRTGVIVAAGIMASCFCAALCAGLLWLSTPPAFPSPTDPPFVAMLTQQVGSSAWLDVTTASPIDLDHAERRVQLDFDVAAQVGTSVKLVFGGGFLKGNPECVGASFTRTSSDSLANDPYIRPLIAAYFMRRPGTGHLFGIEGLSMASSDEASKWASTQPLIVFETTALNNAENKTWHIHGPAKDNTYPVGAATLRCSVDQSAFVAHMLYRTRVIAADIVGDQGNQAGQGPLSLTSKLETRTAVTEGEIRSTFSKTERHADPAGGQVSSYSGDWWTQLNAGEAAIMLEGASVVREPQDAPLWRSMARLGAGLMASLTLASLTATVSLVSSRMRWTSAE